MICPEVTQYGWQNVRILELIHFFFSAFCRTLLFSQLFFWACPADCFLGHVLQTAFWGMFCRCGSKWQCDLTYSRKQVVNRLKIPQGLSTLLFHRWSEVPSRGGVRGDSPYEKLPALQRCHLSVFSECCFLELLASLLLSEFVFLVVLLFFLAFCRALFFSEWF